LEVMLCGMNRVGGGLHFAATAIEPLQDSMDTNSRELQGFLSVLWISSDVCGSYW
jgi:hypothetical protein